jgi:hypothetical protein
MTDPEITELRLKCARMRALLQALLEALQDERDESRPSDYALMRAILFRIGLEIEPRAFPRPSATASDGSAVPRAGGAVLQRGLLAEGILVREHLHDLEQSLTALEVLGDTHRLALRTQGILFAEWQLARLDRLDPGRHPAGRLAAGAEGGRAGASVLPAALAPDSLARVGLGSATDALRDRRLLRDSLARAGAAMRHDPGGQLPAEPAE